MGRWHRAADNDGAPRPSAGCRGFAGNGRWHGRGSAARPAAARGKCSASPLLIKKLAERPEGVQPRWISLGEPERLEAVAARAAERARRYQALSQEGHRPLPAKRGRRTDQRPRRTIAGSLQGLVWVLDEATAADGDRIAEGALGQAELAEGLHSAVVDLAAIRGLRTSELSIGAAARRSNLRTFQEPTKTACCLAGQRKRI